jgi:hypothetical protein
MDVPFRALVLSALWIIIRAAPRDRLNWHAADDWRGNAIAYMDEHGQQTDDAKKYRRLVTFPELPG